MNKNLNLKDLDGEIWKDILDYEGNYQVSNYGRVKSFKRYKNGNILNQHNDKDGYFITCLCRNGIYKPKKIHRLMFESFIGVIPEEYVVHHKDFTKNNYLDNFELMPKSEHSKLHNIENKYCIDRILSEKTKNKISKNHIDVKGENNSNHKLFEKEVIQIHKLIKLKFKTIDIIKLFHISRTQFYRIRDGKSWNFIYKQFYK